MIICAALALSVLSIPICLGPVGEPNYDTIGQDDLDV